MKLLTKEIEKKLPALYSQEEVKDPLCRVKFFTPWTFWTWWIIEKDPDSSRCFGYVEGMENELGYFDLDEIAEIMGPAGLKIERDLYFKPTPLSEVQRRSP